MSNFRSKAFNPVSKKIEDAEYCDDYYGRHRYGIRFDDGCVHPEAQCGIDAAATQLDALQARVKELDGRYLGAVAARGMLRDRADEAESRADALQARVKGLEKENEALQDDSQSSVIVTNWFDLGRELNVPEGGSVFDTVIDLRERATRLQQERDEAYERAIRAVRDERLIDPVDSHDQTYNDALGHAEQAIRRLAGPEKEGK